MCKSTVDVWKKSSKCSISASGRKVSCFLHLYGSKCVKERNRGGLKCTGQHQKCVGDVFAPPSRCGLARRHVGGVSREVDIAVDHVVGEVRFLNFLFGIDGHLTTPQKKSNKNNVNNRSRLLMSIAIAQAKVTPIWCYCFDGFLFRVIDFLLWTRFDRCHV